LAPYPKWRRYGIPKQLDDLFPESEFPDTGEVEPHEWLRYPLDALPSLPGCLIFPDKSFFCFDGDTAILTFFISLKDIAMPEEPPDLFFLAERAYLLELPVGLKPKADNAFPFTAYFRSPDGSETSWTCGYLIADSFGVKLMDGIRFNYAKPLDFDVVMVCHTSYRL
jgi:hypothetical protein